MSTKTFLNRNIWAKYNENRPKCSEDRERTQNIRVNPKILWMFSFFFFLGGGGVIAKLDFIWVSFLCMLGYFLKANERNGNIFLGCKNSKYSFRV